MVLDHHQSRHVRSPARHGQNAAAFVKAGARAGGQIHHADVVEAFVAVVGGVGDARAVFGPGAEIMDRVGRRGQGARFGAGFEQPELLALVAAGIDAPDELIIRGAAAQERHFLVVMAQLAHVAAIHIHGPDLWQPGAPQMEQRAPVLREGGRGGGADLHPGIGWDGHAVSFLSRRSILFRCLQVLQRNPKPATARADIVHRWRVRRFKNIPRASAWHDSAFAMTTRIGTGRPRWRGAEIECIVCVLRKRGVCHGSRVICRCRVRSAVAVGWRWPGRHAERCPGHGVESGCVDHLRSRPDRRGEWRRHHRGQCLLHACAVRPEGSVEDSFREWRRAGPLRQTV